MLITTLTDKHQRIKVIGISTLSRLIHRLPAFIVSALLWFAAPVLADGDLGSPFGERPPNQAQFSVQFADEVIPYNVFGTFVLPNQSVNIAALQTPRDIDFQLVANAGQITQRPNGGWQWQAPEQPGAYQLRVLPTDDTTASNLTGLIITLNVFVMYPASAVEDGKINGFRIDAYPDKPLRGNPIYLPPKGYIEVTEATGKLKVAPHFRLREFVAKQAGGYPKYVVLQERLLLKLEMILERLQAAGYSADSMVVMSGYRTPFYNQSIGNVQYSRHKWGGAADVFIDESPKDGLMDDLNGDGTIDIEDARVIVDLIEGISDDAWYQPMVGGLGLYGTKPHRGPFVHVDVRGTKARWVKP